MPSNIDLEGTLTHHLLLFSSAIFIFSILPLIPEIYLRRGILGKAC